MSENKKIYWIRLMTDYIFKKKTVNLKTATENFQNDVHRETELLKNERLLEA